MTLTDVEQKLAAAEVQVAELMLASNPTTAEERITQRMQQTRAEHSKDGILLADESRLRAYEAAIRAQYDVDLVGDIGKAPAVAEELQQAVDAEIGSQRQILTLSEYHEGGRDALLAVVADELQTDRLTRALEGKTRRQVLDRYLAADDVKDRTFVSIIERAHRSGRLDDLKLTDEPDHDAQAIQRFAKAVAARQDARIKPEWRSVSERVGKLSSGRLKTMRALMLQGVGVANRPTVAS